MGHIRPASKHGKERSVDITTGAAEAATLDTIEEMERRGVALLDAGANPAKLAAALQCVVLRLQLEGRFGSVDTARLEDLVEAIATAQEEDARS
jgi:hypothetical protein